MALALLDNASVTVSMIDRDFNKATVTANVLGSLAFTVIDGWITGDLIPAIEGLSNGVVTGYSVSYGAKDLAAVNTGAPDASDVERKLVFTFVAADNTKGKVEIPSVDNTHIVDGTDVASLTDTAVAAMRDVFTTAGTGGVNAVSASGAVFSGMTSTPHKIHRKSTKG
jgi:hypothetical protein